MASKFWPMVVRCVIGDAGSCWRVVGVPSEDPDLSLCLERDPRPPPGWQDWGMYRDRDRAVEVARFLETAFCKMRGE